MERVLHDMKELLKEESFLKKVQRVLRGLKAPKDSGDYKYARQELVRLLSPTIAILVNVILLVAMTVLTRFSAHDDSEFVTTIVEPTKADVLDMKDETIKKPEIQEDVTVLPSDALGVPSLPNMPQVVAPPETFFSVKPAERNRYADFETPIVMNIYPSRDPAVRGKALVDGGAVGGTNGPTERAVVAALMWLKENQETNGSWDHGAHSSAAMTGLALLCYLAHNEIPGPRSPEFGATVENAIKYLLSLQRPDGNFSNTGGNHVYGNAIAAYAVCEAFAMTKIPALKEASEKAIEVVIQGQQPCGSWNYGYDKSERHDTSVACWQIQALKAAKMAGLENAGLDEAMKKAVDGLKLNCDRNSGGFGYTSPGNGGLTGAGVLCLQFLERGRDAECRQGLVAMKDWTFSFTSPYGARPLYYWYYATQAKFQSDRETWSLWNKIFSPELVKAQIIETGREGKKIGHWEAPTRDEKGLGPVYSTTLCCLMLEVYYRYLPTYMTPKLDTQEKQGTSGEGQASSGFPFDSDTGLQSF